MAEKRHQLCEVSTGRIVIAHLDIAATPWKRAVGLLGRSALGSSEGLWLEPCNGIHTLAMRFPIDVVFLDREGHALRLVPSLRSWRICGPVRNARVVIELPAGTIAAQNLRQGERYRADAV